MSVGVALLSKRLDIETVGRAQAAAQEGGQKHCIYRAIAHGKHKTSELSQAKLARINRQMLGLVESKIRDGNVHRVGGGIIEPVKGDVEIRDARSRNGPACFVILEAGPGYLQGLRSGGENGRVTSIIAIGQINTYVQMIAGRDCRCVYVQR